MGTSILARRSLVFAAAVAMLSMPDVMAFAPSHQRLGSDSSFFVGPLSSRRNVQTLLHAKKGGKKKPAKKKAGGGGGAAGGFGAKVATKEETMYERALKAKIKEVQSSPANARSWLELGSVLVKLGDYAEAEEVFRLGNLAAPNDEMLSGAYVALAGHSAKYFGGDPTRDADPRAVECPFDTYDVNQEAEDFRTVTWTARGDRPRVQLSKEPLLPRDECAEAIRIAEDHAAGTPGGWTSSRHAQAATTDLPVKDIPELLSWFNEKLETTLFPMLAARYPEKIKSASDLRAHDSFIVKYEYKDDGSAQNSLATHVDESAFSFTIALNDRSEYEGGGTCFESIRLQDSGNEFEALTLNADAGGVVSFPGTIRHGGAPVTKGTRYIIPLFLYLHENKTGNNKGYVASQLEEAVEKAQKRQKLMGTSGFSN